MSGQRFKSLLVEGNPGEARLFQEMLAEETGTGYLFDVECANRLPSAIGRLAAGDNDIILLDLSLPDSQGKVTFAKVRESRGAQLFSLGPDCRIAPSVCFGG